MLSTQRAGLIRDGSLTPKLVDVLRKIFCWFSVSWKPDNDDQAVRLNRVEASRLWYRCGIKLSNLEQLLEAKSPPTSDVCFEDFLERLSSVVRAEDEVLGDQLPYSRGTTVFQVSNIFCLTVFLVAD
jgi:hypothetical protein